MPTFEAQDPNFAARIQTSFDRQSFMATIGAELVRADPGYCELALDFRDDLCQQHGYLHGGVTGALADSAAGYAAYTLMPEDSSVLTIEYKLNLIAPAAGFRFVARGQVERAGRNVTVVLARVTAHQRHQEKEIALMQATMMCLPGTPDSPPR
jgi:uncharacterized protein (TIGR00369 family)